jgi:aspartyl-tRNA(Asn)/glutamyl-tRNA(Gln) amidotransferase subunit A
VTELHRLSATEAHAKFVARELSPVELLDAVVTRTERVNPTVNAFTEQMLDDAYDAAREAERRFGGTGAPPRPLEGIPLVLKEEQPIAGRTLEEGSLIEQGNIAQVTHPVVERVYAAGAVVHGRSTTPEFSCAPFTHSTLWGVTRNPWNTAATPGGSSGGAGAVLAAGMTTLATGSDIGGSIRIPASFCGVIGFKPPFGRVPGLPPFNQDTYCADGPMARTVADVAMLQNVLAGPHPGDQASLRPAYRLPDALGDVAGMRVTLCVNLGDHPVDPVVEANTRTAADALRSAGVTVDEVTLPWRREQLVGAAWAHFGAVMGAFIDQVVGGNADRVMPYTLEFAENGRSAGSYVEGLFSENELYRPLGEILERYDALLCPTIGAQSIPADAAGRETPIPCGDATLAWTDVLLTLPFNLVGRVPVLSVPSGLAPAGVPTGVQLVGRTYDDATVFHLGAALERELELWTGPAWGPDI